MTKRPSPSPKNFNGPAQRPVETPPRRFPPPDGRLALPGAPGPPPPGDAPPARRVLRALGDPAARLPSGLPPLPDAEAPMPAQLESGYLKAIEWRPLRGGFVEPGPAAAWTRTRVPVVEGEEPTGLQRV